MNSTSFVFFVVATGGPYVVASLLPNWRWWIDGAVAVAAGLAWLFYMYLTKGSRFGYENVPQVAFVAFLGAAGGIALRAVTLQWPRSRWLVTVVGCVASIAIIYNIVMSIW